MYRGLLPSRVLVAWVGLVLAGCATTRHEAPPTVAPQPPRITTTEAVANAGVAKAQESAPATPAATPAPPDAPATGAPAAMPPAATEHAVAAVAAETTTPIAAVVAPT